MQANSQALLAGRYSRMKDCSYIEASVMQLVFNSFRSFITPNHQTLDRGMAIDKKWINVCCFLSEEFNLFTAKCENGEDAVV